MPITIADLPETAAAASLRLRDELLAILGADLVSAWVHGGTTFADRPVRPGDLDICAVIANVAPNERTPRAWRADPGSRPSRIYAAQEAIAREYGVIVDTMYLLADEVGGGRLPSGAFEKKQRVTGWAVYRAHWLAGQYVLLHGRATRGAHHSADDRGAPPRPGPRTRAPRAARLRGRRRRSLRGDLRDLQWLPHPSNAGNRQPGHLEALSRGVGTREPAPALARRDPRRRSLVRRRRRVRRTTRPFGTPCLPS